MDLGKNTVSVFARWVTLGIFAFGASSCSHPPCQKYLTHPPILKPELLVKRPRPISAFQLREYYVCLLETHGVQVIRLGQTWTIVLPSDSLFDNDTAEINDDYEPILNVVADFLRTYPKISVSVSAFSDKQPEIRTKFGTITDELTVSQAAAVVKYLTKKRTNARLIYAVGRGAHDPVAWDGTEAGRKLNRRVEIHFRYYRDSKAWF